MAVSVVEAIPSMKRGRPLTIGELDGVVQSYIRALREAGTPINASIVIAAANGIVCSKIVAYLLKMEGTLIYALEGQSLYLQERAMLKGNVPQVED